MPYHFSSTIRSCWTISTSEFISSVWGRDWKNENQLRWKSHSLFSRSYRDETGKMRTFNEAVKPLYPLVWLFVISNCWAFFSPNRILEFDPRVFFMITGTIFSNFAVDENLSSICHNHTILTLLFILVPTDCRSNGTHRVQCMQLPVGRLHHFSFNLHNSISTRTRLDTARCRRAVDALHSRHCL